MRVHDPAREAMANAEIAERLSISEKTVRNHISNLFDKLGVWTRAQAMVFARDCGFRADRHFPWHHGADFYAIASRGP
jgi:DNA-binding NarL/FixJ family response regulator